MGMVFPGLQFRFRTAHDGVSDIKIHRRQNISLLAIDIRKQGDSGRPVRVILNGRHLGRDVDLITFKIDNPVMPLMSAAPVPARDTAVSIPATRL